MTHGRRALLDLAVLAGLGGLCVASTARLGAELDPGDFGRPAHVLGGVALAMLAPYVAAVGWVLLRRPPVLSAVALVLVVAAGMRLVLVDEKPALSNDVYRYVWDGRVQAAGINPYRYAPNAPELVPLRDESIYPRMNRLGVRTAYPPVAQGLFAGLYRIESSSIAWTKLAIVILDLCSIGLLAYLLSRLRRPPAWALLYAWHPLVAFELGGAGHVEGLVVLLVLAALAAALVGGIVRTGLLLAAAALVKPYALLLVPALVGGRRALVLASGVVVATIAVAYAPFVDVGLRALGYLPGYLREEGFTRGTRFYLLGLVDADPSTLLTAVYVVLAATLLFGLAAWFVLRPTVGRDALANRALLLFATVWVVASPTYPWYALLAIALLPLARGPVLLPAGSIALTAPFLYLHISVGSHPSWPRHLAYGVPALALGLSFLLHARAQRSAAVASSRTPSPNEMHARNPSTSAAHSVEAKT